MDFKILTPAEVILRQNKEQYEQDCECFKEVYVQVIEHTLRFCLRDKIIHLQKLDEILDVSLFRKASSCFK